MRFLVWLHIIFVVIFKFLAFGSFLHLAHFDLYHGFGVGEAFAKEAASQISVVPAQDRQRDSTTVYFVEAVLSAQQTSLQRSPTASFNSCCSYWQDDQEASLLEVPELPCGHEGHFSTLLEMRIRVGQYGHHVCAPGDQTGLGPEFWPATALEWTVLERTRSELRQQKSSCPPSFEIQWQSTARRWWRLDSWRSTERQQGLWQRSGAVCSCTGTPSANDANDDAVSTAHDDTGNADPHRGQGLRQGYDQPPHADDGNATTTTDDAASRRDWRYIECSDILDSIDAYDAMSSCTCSTICHCTDLKWIRKPKGMHRGN